MKKTISVLPENKPSQTGKVAFASESMNSRSAALLNGGMPLIVFRVSGKHEGISMPSEWLEAKYDKKNVVVAETDKWKDVLKLRKEKPGFILVVECGKSSDCLTATELLRTIDEKDRKNMLMFATIPCMDCAANAPLSTKITLHLAGVKKTFYRSDIDATEHIANDACRWIEHNLQTFDAFGSPLLGERATN